MEKTMNNMKKAALAMMAKKKMASQSSPKIPARQDLGKGRMEVNPFRKA